MVPVGPGIRELHPGGKALADSDRRLGLVRPVVAVLEPQAVPVDGRVHVALVLDVHRDLGALLDPEDRAGNRAVVGEHAHRVVAYALRDRANPKIELVTVLQLDVLW